MRECVAVTIAIVLGSAAAATAQPTTLSSYAVFADERLKIGPTSRTVSGAIGTNGLLKIGKDCIVDGPAVGNDVKLSAGAIVQGTVYFNELNNRGTIQGYQLSPFGTPLVVPPPVPPVL